jgi:hypothetical protein
MNARRNPNQRLSGSSKSRVLVTGPSNLGAQKLTVIEDWARVYETSNVQTTVGLKEANPLDSVIAIKPEAWGERGFDAISQVFTWFLADLQKRPLLLEIGFEGFTEPAIKFLEQVPAASVEGAVLIGRIQRTTRGVSLHPYSLHKQNGDVVHLCLDNVTTSAGKPGQDEQEEDETFEAEEESESATVFSPALSRALDEADDALLALAEAGLASSNPLRIERLKQDVARADRLGLHALKTGLENATDNPRAAFVLRTVYLTRLHRRAMPLSL